MFLTKVCLVIFDRALTYVDALSILAGLLIALFIGYICIRQHKKNKK